MNLRRKSYSALVLLVALFVLLRSTQLTAAETRPNVLFIFADDQMYNTIHSLGNDEVETPNLDRLARRGVTFTHAYNQGSWSGAVCVASRTMLNTGRFLWHADAVYKTSEAERDAGRWWSEYMKQAGYDTYMTGKWHVRADAEKSFDNVMHVRPGMPAQTPEGYNRPIQGEPDPWDPSDPKFGGYWAGGKHWSEVVGDNAETFLARAAGEKKPFFMYLAFNAPHDPRQSPKEFVDKYPLDKIAVPPSFLPEYPFKDAIGCGKGLRDEKLAPFPRTEFAVKVNRQEYYAIITHMDVQIGRILDALEESGKAENTYIFFTADHGLAVGHHGLMGKQNLFDHSVRVPLIVAGPDVPSDKKIHGAVYLQDIMPSTLELAGVERPDHVQFRSLMPVIAGERTGNYDSVYGAYLAVQRSVTKNGFKLILYPEIQKALLFDLKNDPEEMSDLAEDPQHQAVMRELFAEFLKLQKQTGDKMDLRNVFPGL
jgi:choline-sulfatase